MALLFSLWQSTFPPSSRCPLLFACACPPLHAEIAQLSPDQVIRMSILGTEFFEHAVRWFLIIFSHYHSHVRLPQFLSPFKPYKSSTSLYLIKYLKM